MWGNWACFVGRGRSRSLVLSRTFLRAACLTPRHWDGKNRRKLRTVMTLSPGGYCASPFFTCKGKHCRSRGRVTEQLVHAYSSPRTAHSDLFPFTASSCFPFLAPSLCSGAGPGQQDLESFLGLTAFLREAPSGVAVRLCVPRDAGGAWTRCSGETCA